LADASPEFRRIFPSLRDCGYQTQTQWAIRDVIRQGRAGDWARQGRLISLPVDGAEANVHMGFAEKLNHLADGDIVVCVLSAAGVRGQALGRVFADPARPRLGLSRVPPQLCRRSSAPWRFSSTAGNRFRTTSRPPQSGTLGSGTRSRLRWKFILPWGDPVAWALAALGGDSVGDAGPDFGYR
jgi:hypothetical protein